MRKEGSVTGKVLLGFHDDDPITTFAKTITSWLGERGVQKYLCQVDLVPGSLHFPLSLGASFNGISPLVRLSFQRNNCRVLTNCSVSRGHLPIFSSIIYKHDSCVNSPISEASEPQAHAALLR